MSTNEIKVSGGDTIIDPIEETKEEVVEDTATEAKETEQQEAPEAKRARMEGSLKRMAKDLRESGVDVEALLGVKKLEKTSKKSKDFDYGEKAFLNSNGIKGVEEIGFVRDIMDKTGLSLDEIVTDEYAQSKLKSYREARATAQAIPSGTKRSSGAYKDSVEYHLEKYEAGSMNLMDMPFDMREKVFKAKMAKEKAKGMFSFKPNI